MFRLRTFFFIWTACLGGMLFAAMSLSFVGKAVFGDSVPQAGIIVSSLTSSFPEQTAAFVAAMDNVPTVAWSEVTEPQCQVVSEYFCKPLKLMTTVNHPHLSWSAMREYLSGFNWFSSYLPDLEFCTVLSRFRL